MCAGREETPGLYFWQKDVPTQISVLRNVNDIMDPERNNFTLILTIAAVAVVPSHAIAVLA